MHADSSPGGVHLAFQEMSCEDSIIGDKSPLHSLTGSAKFFNECNRLITTVTQRRYQSLVAIGAELG